METLTFPGRLAIQQRVLPAYRIPFFDRLAEHCAGGLTLFAGQARPQEMIAASTGAKSAYYAAAQNIHLMDGGAYLCYQRGILRWLEESQPDALIVEANPRYLATPLAVRWMRARGRMVLGWGLGAPRAAGLKGWFWSAYLHQFDGLVSYSARGAEEYVAQGIPRERVFVAHNSVSPPPNFAMPNRPAGWSPRPAILFVGRLQSRKRVDALLRACAALPNSPRLLIVGEGPARTRLESLAARVYPAAEFIGAKHGVELAPYFLQADLFALPGTGGLAVQEAMSYALPVVVAKGDGTQDDLARDGNGWQIPPEDDDALLAALKNALADPARLRRMGEESFRIVSREININAMAEKFIAALNQTSKAATRCSSNLS